MAKYDLKEMDFRPDAKSIPTAFEWIKTPEGVMFWGSAAAGILPHDEMLRAKATWSEMKRRYKRGKMVYEWEYKP